jgi:hypothetical protein
LSSYTEIGTYQADRQKNSAGSPGVPQIEFEMVPNVLSAEQKAARVQMSRELSRVFHPDMGISISVE